MFTQCSNCNTVFELSAEILRAAGGQVRCGRCGEIFNALARLAEDAASFDTGESAFELEERADSILESVVAEQTPPTSPVDEYGDIEVAQLQILDSSQDNFIDETVEDAAADPAESDGYTDAALEFTLPPDELDRIFVESSVGIMPPFHALDSIEHDSIEHESVELEMPPHPEAAHLDAAHPEAAHLDAAHLDAAHLDAAHPEAALFDPDEPLPDIEVISDDRSLHDRPRPVRPLLSPVVELGAIDLSEAPRRPAGSVALWLSASIAAGLLLIGQWVHHNRAALTADGPLAPMFRALYERLGRPVGGAPNLAAFQLRQWGVTGEATADPTLRVRASILNTTSQSQPFPLLRVTLANRYGAALGTRDFAPNEYLGKPISRLLSPGEQVDAVLNILDPGKDAEGFEIDVCLPGAEKKMICANDATPSQAR